MKYKIQNFYEFALNLRDKANLARIYFENDIKYPREIFVFIKDKDDICHEMEAYIYRRNDMNLAEQCTLIHRNIFTRLLQATRYREDKQSIVNISLSLYNIEKWFISQKCGISLKEAEDYYIDSEDGKCKLIENADTGVIEDDEIEEKL